MAVNSIPSNNVPAPAAQPQKPQTPIDRPAEKQAQPAPKPAEPAPAPRPSVNTSGQTIGTRINTSA